MERTLSRTPIGITPLYMPVRARLTLHPSELLSPCRNALILAFREPTRRIRVGGRNALSVLAICLIASSSAACGAKGEQTEVGRYSPPEDVNDIWSFFEWWEDDVDLWEVRIAPKENCYFVELRTNRVASGQPAYLFDRRGKLVEWRLESENGFKSRVLSNGEATLTTVTDFLSKRGARYD